MYTCEITILTIGLKRVVGYSYRKIIDIMLVLDINTTPHLHTRTNKYVYTGIKGIPYVLQYGQLCRTELKESIIPSTILDNIETEEELEEASANARIITRSPEHVPGRSPQDVPGTPETFMRMQRFMRYTFL